jgi:hypothetical protein
LFANEKKVNHGQEPGMKKVDYNSISTSDNHVNNRDKPYERLYKFEDLDTNFGIFLKTFLWRFNSRRTSS